MKEKSNTFCPAKWESISIDLENGTVRSCHYPLVKKLTLKELSTSLSFHNTKWLNKQRDLMLKNLRPSECQYCWNLEDKNLQSPREKWLSLKKKDELSSPLTLDLKRVEVSFSSHCQMKCSYCSACTSSSIAKEQDKFGPYFFEKIKKEKSQSHESFFWPWLEKHYDNLEQIRVTGGEPFLGDHLSRLISLFKRRPHKKLNLSINSNFSLPEKVVGEFVHEVNSLINEEKLGSFTVFTSLDAWGEQGEYIRSGLNLELWLKNIKLILERSYADIVVTCTFSLLSFESIQKFVNKLEHLNSSGRIKITFSKLEYPRYLSVDYATKEAKEILARNLKEVTSQSYLKELNSLYEMVGSKNRSVLGLKSLFWRICFRLFIKQYDERKGLSFEKTFPELHSQFPQFNVAFNKLLCVAKLLRLKNYGHK